MLDKAKSQAAVGPCLGRVPESAFLGAEQEESLHRWNSAVSTADLFKNHAAGMLSEDCASLIRLIKKPLSCRVTDSPPDGVGEHGIQQSVRVIGTHGLHVTLR